MEKVQPRFGAFQHTCIKNFVIDDLDAYIVMTKNLLTLDKKYMFFLVQGNKIIDFEITDSQELVWNCLLDAFFNFADNIINDDLIESLRSEILSLS